MQFHFKNLDLLRAHKLQVRLFMNYNRIENAFDEMKKEMRTSLASIDFVCATADCWSSSNRSYLGVTIHWLDESMSQKSQALACKRIVGSHTYDVLAEALESILLEFQVQMKFSVIRQQYLKLAH